MFWLNILTKEEMNILDAAIIGDNARIITILSNPMEYINIVPIKVDHVYTNGDTALHYASRAGETECVATLLKYNANPKLKNMQGRMPIHLAIRWNNVGCVEELLKIIDIETINNDGYTLLHYAASEGVTDCVQLLLDRGANKYARDNQGFNTMDTSKTSAISNMIKNHQEIPYCKHCLQ